MTRRWGGPRMPRLAAVSGWGQPEDRRLSREAGFEAHFAKPADIDEVIRRMRL